MPSDLLHLFGRLQYLLLRLPVVDRPDASDGAESLEEPVLDLEGARVEHEHVELVFPEVFGDFEKIDLSIVIILG
jgi:hypothetical protein